MRRFIREPLVHFALAATLIFFGYNALSGNRDAADKTIYVSTADMERMAALYAGEAGTLPSANDIRAMVSDHVQQEALVREARRLRLDNGDVIVERRLAQKMAFIVADMTELSSPSEAVLRDWFEANATKFERPARASFQHVFFANPSDIRIETVLTQLNQGDNIDWRTLGDPFILQREYANLPKREIIRQFGAPFADFVLGAQQTDQAWLGPATSAYGVHFYRVLANTDARRPDFDSVRPAVEQDWRDANLRIENAKAIAEIINKYTVVIEGTEP